MQTCKADQYPRSSKTYESRAEFIWGASIWTILSSLLSKVDAFKAVTNFKILNVLIHLQIFKVGYRF